MESIIKEINFESPCPCQKCINKTEVHKWVHLKCGSFVTINSDLNIRCLKCNKTIDYQQYPFKCKDHQEKEPPSKEGSIYAFNVMKNLSQDELTKEYISLIIENIQKRFKSSSNNNTPQGNDNQNEVKFISTCPVQSCINKDELNFWYHPDPSCRGELSLDIEGNVHCTKCGLMIPFIEWPFECDNHKGIDFASSEGILNAVESLKEIFGHEKSTLFFETLTNNLLTKYMQLSDNELEEIEFVAPCPCKECELENQVYNWKHPYCEGKLHLTIKGEIKCVRCEEKKKFIKWPFDCKRHENKEASTEGMQHCFQIINLSATFDKKKEFIAKVTSIVIQQFINLQNIKESDEIEFAAPCPVDKCKFKKDIIEWKHQNCGGVLVLTIEGYIKCKKCNESSLFVKWPFNCGDHGDELPSIQGACNSLGTLSKENNKDNDQLNFMLQITSIIMNQFISRK